MRFLQLFRLILPGVMILTSSISAATLEFDPALVEFDAGERSVSYGNLESIPIGTDCKLSCDRYYLPLLPGETHMQIKATVLTSVIVGQANWENLHQDIPTGELDQYPDRPIPNLETSRFGSKAIEIIGSIETESGRWAQIQVWPVYIDDHGNLRLARQIAISVGNREVSTDNITREVPNLDISRDFRQTLSLSGSSISGTQYLIVTSQNLLTTLQPLADYKTSCGIVTELVAIEDAITGYSGVDDAEKLREYLKDFHTQGGEYVLMAGDETILPVRHAYHLPASELPELAMLQLSDLYFADLTADWDEDQDGIWGERTMDATELVPELIVGRLPFSQGHQFEAYIEKLIKYESSPGAGQPDYLTRAFFFSSDQMRDYSGGGQHGRIAAAYPEYFQIDTTHGVEFSRGDDENPTNAAASELGGVLSEGFGIINIIAHGTSQRFEVRTSNYNYFPKSYFTTDEGQPTQGQLDQMISDNKPSLFYSLACNNGGFDIDSENYPNIAVELLAQPDGGAIGFVANSRWGWVSSSHLLQKLFFDSLFAGPDKSVVAAMYDSKFRYAYYRDLLYGQNFLGDPTLKIFTNTPENLTISELPDESQLRIVVSSNEVGVADCLVIISDSTGIVDEGNTDGNGEITFNLEYAPEAEYTIAAVKQGYTIERIVHTPSIVASIDDDPHGVPGHFSLNQNYPNPFNPTTRISFELQRRANITITIYNMLGQEVAVLTEDEYPLGVHEVVFAGVDKSGRTLSSGVYLYRLQTDEQAVTRKMLLLR